MKIVVTGITGYVGAALAPHLLYAGHEVVALVRSMPARPVVGVDYIAVGEYTQVTDWAPYLQGVGAVIHLAAVAHQNADAATYTRMNIDVTRALLAGAQAAHVGQFVFMSSIKVLGEETPAGQPFTRNSTPNPQDAYGRSKLAAEELVRESGIPHVILRPPLVYGAQVKGNLQALQRLIQKRVPLPLASIHNKRSMVNVERLAAMLVESIHAPQLRNGTWLVADAHDYSTPEIVQMLGRSIGVHPILLPCPPIMLQILCAAIGKQHIYQRLCGNLQVDAHETIAALAKSGAVL